MVGDPGQRIPSNAAVGRDDPQPLSYATPDADGLPEFVPEAEVLLDERQPLSKLRKLFRRAADVPKYVAKSYRRRKAKENAGHACECCGAAAEWVVPVDWWITMSVSTFALSRESVPAETRTHHSLCNTCMDRWANRVLRFSRWRWVAIVFGWLWLPALFLNKPIASLLGFAPNHGAVLSAWFWILLAGMMVKALMRRWHAFLPPRPIRLAMPREARFKGFDVPDEWRGSNPLA